MIDSSKVERLAIRPDPSQRFLQRVRSEEPFIPLADTAWEIFHRCTKEEVAEYLDIRQSQGFNSILAVLTPELDVKGYGTRPYQGDLDSNGRLQPPAPGWNDGLDKLGGSRVFYPSRYGQVPFFDDDPLQPNELYFEFVDWVVDQAARRGILTWIVPVWSRFVTTGWADGPILFDEDKARSFGRYVGQRYPFCPKLIGGDSNPIWTNGAAIKARAPRVDFENPKLEGVKLPDAFALPRIDTYKVWEALAEGIVESEAPFWSNSREGGGPFLAYHPCSTSFAWSPRPIASNFFGSRAWLTIDGCQSGHCDKPKLFFDPPVQRWDARSPHVPISEMWNAVPVRPVLDLEGHYDEAYNGLSPGSSFLWDEHDIVRGAWQSMLSGACGVVYGCNVVWQMYDKREFSRNPSRPPVCGTSTTMSWKKSLHLPAPKRLKVLHDFFLSLSQSSSRSRQPRQDVLVSSDCPDRWKERDGRIDIMSDAAGSASAWLVAHSGRGYPFVLDLTMAFGEGEIVEIAWVNTFTGKEYDRRSIPATARAFFQCPVLETGERSAVLVVRACSSTVK